MNTRQSSNQNFVSIPYKTLINMIEYKAKLEGIEVRIVSENYTSGTSFLDGEKPTKDYYDKSRRVKRGEQQRNTDKRRYKCGISDD